MWLFANCMTVHIFCVLRTDGHRFPTTGKPTRAQRFWKKLPSLTGNVPSFYKLTINVQPKSWMNVKGFPKTFRISISVYLLLVCVWASIMNLAQIACFPTLGIGCMSSCAWHRLHVFLHSAPVGCLPALGIVACLAALGTGCMYFCTWH